MEDDPNASYVTGESTDYHGSSTSYHVTLIGGHNKWEWIFVLTSLTTIVLLFVCSIRSFNCNNLSVYETMVILNYVVCLSCGISLFFAMYGIFREHKYEIYMHSLWLFLALIFNWIIYVIDYQCMPIFKLVINVSGVLLCFSSFLLAFKATHVRDWVEFQIIGVSEALTNMYIQLRYFFAILKADSAYMIIFAIYSAHITYAKQIDETGWWIYQGEILAFAFLSWLCGRLSVYYENMCLVRGFYLLNTFYLAVIIYQIYCAFISPYYIVFRYAVIVFGVLAILIKIYIITQMYKSSRKFGHELNSSSFRELVSRNSSSLLARSRTAMQF